MSQQETVAARREKILAGHPRLPKEVAALRRDSVTDLPRLLKQSQTALKDKGCSVYMAANKKDAQSTIRDLLVGQNQVVRTYSNALREISFDHVLHQMRIKIRKSLLSEILGDYLDCASPGHPFLFRTDQDRDKVIEALQKFVDAGDVVSPEQLNKAAHQKIKNNILQCEFGVTGVNGIAAENGTLVIIEDEGNIRAVSNLPYRHLAVAGIEKIVATVEASLKIQECQSIYGLGSRSPTYYSLISGPSRTGDIEFRITYGMHGPKEVHVILLDNGRLSLVEQGFGELLRCIDCGACYQSMASLSTKNGWSGIARTPKGIALGIIQGALPVPKADQAVAEFDCPVNITGARLGPIFKQIDPVTDIG